MNLLKICVMAISLSTSMALAESGDSGFGLNVGIGLPYVGQAGVNYKYSSSLSFSAEYNMLSISTGSASAKLTMPEVMVNYHPFDASFFIGAGVGQESLEVKATESTSNSEAQINVDAMTAIAKLGWMWGIVDKGFWFGIDLSYIMPLSPKRSVSAPGVSPTDPNYLDAIDAADKFGKTSYINITFARIGYIF
jgi:hypothetical protein